MPAVHPLKLVNAQMQVLRARLRSIDTDDIRERLQDVRPIGYVDQPAVIDVSGVPGDELDAAHWPEILDSFRAVGLNPIALTGAADSSAQQKLAARLGLAPVDGSCMAFRFAVGEVEVAGSVPADADADADAPAPTVTQAPFEFVPPATSQASADIAPPATPGWQSPLIIDRQVRSGQQVYARHRDVVVLAAVSPGAEVIADGSVTCYGALRGRAIAGASGKADAYIHALDFRPELVAVAGLYMTFESGPPAMPSGRIVQVRLDAAGDRLVIEPI
jgi:septum site-determining protein MinC